MTKKLIEYELDDLRLYFKNLQFSNAILIDSNEYNLMIKKLIVIIDKIYFDNAGKASEHKKGLNVLSDVSINNPSINSNNYQTEFRKNECIYSKGKDKAMLVIDSILYEIRINPELLTPSTLVRNNEPNEVEVNINKDSILLKLKNVKNIEYVVFFILLVIIILEIVGKPSF